MCGNGCLLEIGIGIDGWIFDFCYVKCFVLFNVGIVVFVMMFVVFVIGLCICKGCVVFSFGGYNVCFGLMYKWCVEFDIGVFIQCMLLYGVECFGKGRLVIGIDKVIVVMDCCCYGIIVICCCDIKSDGQYDCVLIGNYGYFYCFFGVMVIGYVDIVG